MKMAYMSLLRKCKREGKRVRKCQRIYMSIPLEASHCNHELTGTETRIHPKVKHKLYSLVETGITDAAVIRRLLRHYVTHELCR